MLARFKPTFSVLKTVFSKLSLPRRWCNYNSSETLLVDGEFEFCTASPKYRDEIMEQVLSTFHVYEPVERYLGFTRDDAEPVIGPKVDEALVNPEMSIIVFNAKKKIIATRLSSVVDLVKHRRLGLQLSPIPPESVQSRFTKNSQHFWDLLWLTEYGVIDLVPFDKCTLCMKMLLTNVDPEYWGHRISTNALRLSYEQTKKYGCDVIFGTATTDKGNRAEKAGVLPLKVIKHKDFLDEDGNRILNLEDQGLDTTFSVYRLV